MSLNQLKLKGANGKISMDALREYDKLSKEMSNIDTDTNYSDTELLEAAKQMITRADALPDIINKKDISFRAGLQKYVNSIFGLKSEEDLKSKAATNRYNANVKNIAANMDILDVFSGLMAPNDARIIQREKGNGGVAPQNVVIRGGGGFNSSVLPPDVAEYYRALVRRTNKMINENAAYEAYHGIEHKTRGNIAYKNLRNY